MAIVILGRFSLIKYLIVTETSDTVSRVGGNFKETLREMGGLDSIFDVMVDFHSTLENLIKDTSTSALDRNEGTSLQSAALLLKCLKILENAIFLSDDNKTHLLNMSRKLNPKRSLLSFVGVIINTIELLSALSILQNSSVVSSSTYPKSSKVSQQSYSADVMGGTSFNDGKSKNSKKKNFCRTRHVIVAYLQNQKFLILLYLLVVMLVCHRRHSIVLHLYQAMGHQVVH
ncbi:hypothetical protein DAI22_10g146000 [Oryza sativa Japonica Group]|nr:hypothetical protein DAI22_10g146000 [Oryza sativa Japonica Group]